MSPPSLYQTFARMQDVSKIVNTIQGLEHEKYCYNPRTRHHRCVSITVQGMDGVSTTLASATLVTTAMTAASVSRAHLCTRIQLTSRRAVRVVMHLAWASSREYAHN